MKVVTVACAKGGSTKSSVVAALAVRAARESARVAMFDLNADQANLTQWWTVRGEPMNPRLITDVENISRDVERLREDTFEHLIIDTPPLDLDVIEGAIMQSDAVVVPVRCSVFDLGAVLPVVEMCKQHHRPFKFLLSAVDGRWPKLVDQVLAALIPMGDVLSTRVSYKQAYIQAVTVGRVGFEVDKSLVMENDSLWQEVKRLASTAAPLAVRARAANE